MSKLKILDLCSGIGGFSLGLEATGGFETIAFCEFDPFCQKVLNKHWPEVPIYNDLKEISKDEETIRNIPEHDLICGGIPCQPFSVAGKQKGKEDDRHLWPFMFKIIEQKKPTWVIVENVGGFVNVALDDVCLDLEAEGYATQSFIIPACGVEAPHRRDRIWIIGKYTSESRQSLVNSDSFRSHEHKEAEKESSRRGAEATTTTTSEDVADSESNRENGLSRKSESEHDKGNTRLESKRSSNRRRERKSKQDVADSKFKSSNNISNSRSDLESQEERQETRTINGSSSGQDVADSDSERLQGGEEARDFRGEGEEAEQFSTRYIEFFEQNYWRIEPRVGRVANGIPNRVDRLKSLGNAIVPQIIYHIGLAILKEEE